ncbi:MAG: thioredoxin family protein [Nitrososphaerales archaeon]
MKVKVLGTVKALVPGCPRCNDIKRLVINALSEHQLATDVQDVKDPKDIARWRHVHSSSHQRSTCVSRKDTDL